jgi:hypothetical protein
MLVENLGRPGASHNEREENNPRQRKSPTAESKAPLRGVRLGYAWADLFHLARRLAVDLRVRLTLSSTRKQPHQHQPRGRHNEVEILISANPE